MTDRPNIYMYISMALQNCLIHEVKTQYFSRTDGNHGMLVVRLRDVGNASCTAGTTIGVPVAVQLLSDTVLLL